MAVTVSETAAVWGASPASKVQKNFVVATVTFDSSYPTGGEAISVTDFPSLASIDQVIVGSNDEAGVSCRWDKANSKLKLFDEDNASGIEAEFANAGDASANVVTILVVGNAGSL
jgi:hypothetical protein